VDGIGRAEQGPIRLVTFDLYDTLIELYPPRWERFHSALFKLGVRADLEAIRMADIAAEDFYTEENARQPIRDRPKADREAFRLDFTERWLDAAGIECDPPLVRAARQGYLAEFETPAVENAYTYGYRAFPDVVPALVRLREAGVKRAVISNADSDVTELCRHMAFAHEMDLIVTSAIVGLEKPDVRTFQAAFEPLGIEPSATLHIGDQPKSDITGAVRAGMRAALIDRYERHDPANHEVPVLRDLHALVDYVLSINGAAAHRHS
jgi:HAD superfamily hydrolase (TIGR01549 family)